MPTLLVLLKYPAAGQVKTRLAKSLGAERAAALYREWIEMVLARVQPLRGEVRLVAYYAGAPRATFGPWEQLADEWWPQPEGDLGTRLAAGFERAHALGQPVVAIGTDCLELNAAAVRDAFARLSDHDAVFGPTPDGGYYLVGTARQLPGFFDGIPWSSPDTLSTHLTRCEQRGWSASLLPTRRDIDTADDWQSYLSAHDATVPTIAVVIPTLDEEAVLEATLQSIVAQADGSVRGVVADGGSTDGTLEIARNLGATVIAAPRRGRGCQIAAAIRTLSEDVVLVLHADTRLPPGALARIRRHLADHPECPGGCLGHRFESQRTPYRIVEALDALRARWGVSYGDQGQFFRRATLERQGGFPDQPIMEDVELSRRLRAVGRSAYLDCPVLASPRRLERLGLWRSAVLNLVLRAAYRVGGTAACERLHRFYYSKAENRSVQLATTTEARS